MIVLDIDSGGHLFPKNQVTDYICRGPQLDSYSLLEFFVDTYEGDVGRSDLENTDAEEEDNVRVRLGRPRHMRVQYLAQHPKADIKLRIIRATGHRNLPNFVGRYFPRRDDSKVHDFYCTSVLLLLKPWRNLRLDLKVDTQTWLEALQSFLADAPPQVQTVISGI